MELPLSLSHLEVDDVQGGGDGLVQFKGLLQRQACLVGMVAMVYSAL